ncbi:hypothetical protein VNI00_012221 [Paramarasmius palmivorus]|uniref:Uncharacterized protein n=1 Tax=Paramarasmius palmivorus TaxID=297713 RepID=A0AAW0C639_9AGAR
MSSPYLGTGVALITGSAQGIGKAIALRLAKDGFDVVLNDITSQTKLDQLREVEQEIQRSFGRKTAIVMADVSDEEEVKRLVDQTVGTLGGLDVMVANAGVCPSVPMIEKTWERAFAVNVRGTFLCYKYAAIQMIKQGRGGRIIGACSSAGKQGRPNSMAYSATKFAVRGMTQSAAWEVAKHGITVNAYAPGPIETEMIFQLIEDKKRIDPSFSPAQWDCPTGRMGQAEEVAALVSFIASKDSNYITGKFKFCLNYDASH